LTKNEKKNYSSVNIYFLFTIERIKNEPSKIYYPAKAIKFNLIVGNLSSILEVIYTIFNSIVQKYTIQSPSDLCQFFLCRDLNSD
jgi:hypothetical protein